MAHKDYITALRFPLAVLVVLIHAYNEPWRALEVASQPDNPFFLLRPMLSVAVPAFFVISGYLFFLDTRHFDDRDYRHKLSRRVWTLLIPYLLWNLLAYALFEVKAHFMSSPSSYTSFTPNLFWGCKQLGGSSVNIFGLTVGASTSPELAQLWFVRDLIVTVLLSPLLYGLWRGCRWWGLAALAFIYYTGLWLNYGGITFTSVWYFSLGAWVSLSGRDLLRFIRPLLPASALLWLPLTVAMIALPDTTSIGQLARHYCQEGYILTSIVLALYASDFAVRHRRPSRWLASSSFFVYAAHTIVLLPLTTIAVHYAEGASPLTQTMLYLLCALIAILCCLFAFYVLQHYMPRLSAPLTGIWKK